MTNGTTESQLLRKIFLNDMPLLDVRAEVEFAQGAFPLAVNMPILSDDERHCVGIQYKQEGPEAAESLGDELVSGAKRAERIARWAAYIDDHEGALVYCFRGGKRSQIACQWLSDGGRQSPRVPGGYKAMRRFLIGQFSVSPPLVIVSGKTGVGKTALLAKLENSLDLEGLAHHRGSAFGRYIRPQPVQINFENQIAIELLKFKHAHQLQSLFIEDEGRLIGKLQLPPELQTTMKTSPIVLLEDTSENRVQRIYDEYIVTQWTEYEHYFQETAIDEFSSYLRTAVDAIAKRLGGAAHKVVRQLLDDALSKQQSGGFDAHKDWISTLLTDYYDPMYAYQIEKKVDRIIFSGGMQEVIDWARSSKSDEGNSRNKSGAR